MKTKLLPRYFVGFCLSALLMLAGCSGQPSEGMGQKVLAHEIQTQSKGQIKLVSFHKTNGKSADALGVQLYEIDYEAVIEFQSNGYWTHGGAAVPFGFSTQYDRMAKLIGISVDGVSQGQQTTINGVMVFQKTEKGWQGEDGGVY